MGENMVFQHEGAKEGSFLKKLHRFGNYFTEEEHPIDPTSRINLIECIHQARQEWLTAAANFDQADNEDMVDYYIYRMKACQIRYNYLLKIAKENGLKQNVYEAQ